MSKQKDIYLVAHYYQTPKPGVNTSVAGWMNAPGALQYDEKVEITRGLKKNSIDAKVILNFTKKTVERNSFKSDRSFDELFRYYFEGYHQYITAVMTNLDPEYLTKQVEVMEQELTKEDSGDNDPDVQSEEKTPS